ncbi:MAG TPA: 6-phosphogluconolactonase, partial [Mariniphaga sp.]|nr:6-phosphogluconolactonase [Mariniphaga sp.]
RCVPPDDDQSNYKMTFDTLFSKIEIPADNIHRIKGEKTPEEEAGRYAAEIADNLELRNGVPVFDLIILGLGEDGHTASIFPDQLDLLKVDKLCAVATHPESGQKRITLTGKVINNANNIFFLVTGQQKAKRLSEIMNNEEVAQNHPAAHIEPHEGSVIWFIDETAALEIG